ncbi:ParB-like nuclease [Sphingobium sp. MI1205]|nr:ParB-like nuclease [Sphingobium sp. MI1205]
MAIQPVPLDRLVRAPENVRHTDKAADVDSLADDIAAKGLLQNLIGYADIDAVMVYVVGGGRRLQALHVLRERGLLDDSFAVPVLIRDQAEAVELSLSENLAKRDMNPADEFLAFQELMRPGTLSPADLAKRFGFSERYVKQRLRLAGLVPEILDAMRQGKLTIDAAMAYAGTQDQKLQLKIFHAEAKKGTWGHGVQSIRGGIVNAQMRTGDPLFKLVGKADYEKKGGRYEDDLFADAEGHDGRKLIDPDIIVTTAADRAHFQQARLLSEAQASHPTTSDLLPCPGLRIGRFPTAPKGYVLVERPYWRQDLPAYPKLRDQAAAKGIDIVGVYGVEYNGKLIVHEQFFVPGARLPDLIPPQQAAPRKSEAEYAAERRAASIRGVAAWLVARDHYRERPEGRIWWETTQPHLGRTVEQDGLGECYTVGMSILVTPEEIDARLEDAQKEYLLQEAEKAAQREAEERAKAEAAAALEARRAEVLAMDPAPIVILVDGLAHFRWENGGYADEQEDAGEDLDGSYYDDLEELLECAGSIGPVWPSIEAWAENPHGDNVAEIEEEAA